MYAKKKEDRRLRQRQEFFWIDLKYGAGLLMKNGNTQESRLAGWNFLSIAPAFAPDFRYNFSLILKQVEGQPAVRKWSFRLEIMCRIRWNSINPVKRGGGDPFKECNAGQARRVVN